MSELRQRDPLVFAAGKHHSLNLEELVRSKERIRNALHQEHAEREETRRLQEEEKESKRQDKIQREFEKKIKRQPWLANSPSVKLAEERKKAEDKYSPSVSPIQAARYQSRGNEQPQWSSLLGQNKQAIDDKYNYDRYNSTLFSAKDPQTQAKDAKSLFTFPPKPLADSNYLGLSNRSKSKEYNSTAVKSTARLVKELVGRKVSGDKIGSLNRSTSEASVNKVNKPLIPLPLPTVSKTKQSNIPRVDSTDKRDIKTELDTFFKKNYGVSK